MIAVLVACAAAILAQDPPDPIQRIHELIDEGSYADAAEAVRGLPLPARTREDAYLRYQAYDLRGAKAAALEALQSDPKNASLWLLVGDAEAVRGDLDAAVARYETAKALKPLEPGIARALAERDRFVVAERSYRERVEIRTEIGRTVAIAWIAIAAAVMVGAMRRAIRGL